MSSGENTGELLTELIHSAVDYDQRVVSKTEILSWSLQDQERKEKQNVDRELAQIRNDAIRNSEYLKRALRILKEAQL